MGKRRRGRSDGKPSSSAKERLEFAESRFRESINISINGPCGLNRELTEKFGVAIRNDVLNAMREEVREAMAKEKAGSERRTEEARAMGRPVLSRSDVDRIARAAIPKVTRRPVVLAPGAGRSTDDAKIRYDFARSYLQRHPNAMNKEVLPAVQREFGIGINGSTVGTIRRELGVGRIKRRHNERRRPSPPAPKPKPAIVEHFDPHPFAPETPATPIDTIRIAVQMLVDEVPNLRSLTLTIVDGKPSVTYGFAVNRIETGEIEL